MDVTQDDERKPFDAETGNDEDAQPDPDEHLMLDQGNGKVWLVKVYRPPTAPFFPEFLCSSDPKVSHGTLGLSKR